MRKSGFTLVELLAVIVILLVLGSVMSGAAWKVYESSSLAVSANNIRQLAAGAAAYLGDNQYQYWKFREGVPGQGVKWWFGMEPIASFSAGEGNRTLKPEDGPLGPYVPAGYRPDPSFSFTGKAFKPKYRFGYIGIAYNVLLGDSEFDSRKGWLGTSTPASYWKLERPAKIVVFATSAQVNTFQRPASASNPMVEEFYGFDEKEVTIHGRHDGRAMVAYADGSCGFLELDPSTLDPRAPEANVGRFAPKGSTEYLKPTANAQ